jgi:hypothetical protein
MEGDVRWTVTIEGNPALRCVLETRPTFAGGAPMRGANTSGTATAMAAVNSLRHVVDAAAGLLTAVDMPQPRWRGSHR